MCHDDIFSNTIKSTFKNKPVFPKIRIDHESEPNYQIGIPVYIRNL